MGRFWLNFYDTCLAWAEPDPVFVKSGQAWIWISLTKLGPWTNLMIYVFWDCGPIDYAFRLRGLTRWVGSISLKQQISSIKCAKQVPPKKSNHTGVLLDFNHDTRAPTKKITPFHISLWQVSLSQPCPWNRCAIPFRLLLSRCPRFSAESLVFRSPQSTLLIRSSKRWWDFLLFLSLSLNIYLLLYIVFFSL